MSNHLSSIDSLTGEALLSEAVLSVRDYLTAFANSQEFISDFSIAFGNSFDVSGAEDFRDSWGSGDFSAFPEIEIRSGAELNGVNGAFSVDTGKIYLKRVFAFLSERLFNFWIWYKKLKISTFDWCILNSFTKTTEAHQWNRKTLKSVA